MSSETNTSYVPNVKYEEVTGSSLRGGGLKVALLVMTVVALTFLVLGALVINKTLTPPNPNFIAAISLTSGSLLVFMPLFLLSAWKSAYNDIYPQGNWRNFLKRNWSDFLGSNYTHYRNWKASQLL